MISLNEQVLQIVTDMSVTGDIGSDEDLLVEDLGYDSLSLVDMIVALEDILNISFDISKIDPNLLKRVKDIINLVENGVERCENE